MRQEVSLTKIRCFFNLFFKEIKRIRRQDTWFTARRGFDWSSWTTFFSVLISPLQKIPGRLLDKKLKHWRPREHWISAFRQSTAVRKQVQHLRTFYTSMHGTWPARLMHPSMQQSEANSFRGTLICVSCTRSKASKRQTAIPPLRHFFPSGF
jgi:hypothetical protein